MRTRRLARRAGVAAFVLGVALAVGLAAGGGTVAAQSAPDCSTVGFTQNASGYYEVTNVDQLQCVGNASSGVALDDDYVLTSDIDASETSTWHGGDGFRPIGASVSGDFNGTFDGNGSRITDLTVNRTSERETGLVAAAGTAAVFTDVTLVRLDVTGGIGTGGLVGYSEGEVRGASVGGTVTGEDDVGGLIGNTDRGSVTGSTASGTVTGDHEVGGLIGENDAPVSDSSASADVSGGDEVGGLIGDSDEPVSDSSAAGDVTGDDAVGGLIGNTDRGSVTGSTASGAVTGDGNTTNAAIGGLVGANGAEVTDSTADGPVAGDGTVGGLVGYNFESTVEGSTANGAVSGTANVGGLVGYNLDGTIATSLATGDVTASGGQRVGGLVGFNGGGSGGSTVRESFATGSVTGGDDAGGLVGQNRDDAIVDSYALGDVDGDANVGCLVGNNTGSGSTVETSYAACSVSGSSNVGGLVGLTANGATVTDSYWDTDEDGNTSDGGEGLPTANMTGAHAESNMTGFDFTNTWVAEPGSYPDLESNTRTTEPGGDEGDTEGSGDDTPDITDYDVRADGGEITVSFHSDENLVEVTVEVTGAETATLDRDDFSGDTYSGFSATYAADTDGSYTVELTEARDSANNDGTEGETFRRSVTVRTEDDNGTATPTDNGTATPTAEPDTPTPTPTAEPDTPSPTQPEDTPGFGVVVTLVALLGAALLASRRRDGAA